MMDPPHTGPKMEARRSSGSTFVEAPRELELDDLDEEARVYGSRWVEVEAADGSVRFEEVPLRWKDLFDPQEGDWLVQGPEHNTTTGNVGTALRCLMKARGVDDVMVYEDVRIDWQTPGVSPVCPDITVVPVFASIAPRPLDQSTPIEGSPGSAAFARSETLQRPSDELNDVILGVVGLVQWGLLTLQNPRTSTITSH